jgi:hypothetical protein
MGWLWGHDCFKLNACNFCDDITAEVADITFGDAVAETYSYGNEGANFVLVRRGPMRDLLVKGASKGEIVLERVPLQAVVGRQNGVVLLKRDDLQHRLYLIRNKGNAAYVPVKRIPPRERLSSSLNRDMQMRDRMREVSRHTYAANRHKPEVVREMEEALRTVAGKFDRSNLAYRLLRRAAHPLLSLKKRIIALVRRL